MENLNRWLATANLTRDPEMKETPGGVKIANMRIAVNGRVKRGDEWVDQPNYFDLTAFGATADFCGKYLKKGSGIAVDARAQYQEWEATDGSKRNRVVFIVDKISGTDGGGGGGGQRASDAPDPEPVGAAASTDPDFTF